MFPSFFIAGFEGTTGLNRHREWIDSVVRTRHDIRIMEDYARIQRAGMGVVRECIRWPLIDQRGRLDLRIIDPILRAARKHAITVIYDLFHFGYPWDLNPMTADFQNRFADYCLAVARYIAHRADGPYYFTPINEPSYFAWAAGEQGCFAPYLTGRGSELKQALVASAIRGINAIWEGCPQARIVNVDPFCRMYTGHCDPTRQSRCDEFNNVSVFESWDMLAGELLPELGGSRRHLDIIGLNYYWTNQWEMDCPVAVCESDSRRLPLSEIVRSVWQRYETHIVITETSHEGENRVPWLEELARQIELILDQDVPLEGVCWYPIFEMPEWHDRSAWTRMGLWELDHQSGSMDRIPYKPALAKLQEIQERLNDRYFREKYSCA